MEGRVHSLQSLGTVDGPGLRYVVFLQGCPLRCVYCHNPDTWDPAGGAVMGTEELVEKILRCRPYFGTEGGVTVSGGEPLLQAEFVTQLFARLKREGVHTALDTCGYFPEKSLSSVLALTDLVLFVIKLMGREAHHKYMGVSNDLISKNLRTIIQSRAEVFIRIPVIPGVNDAPENLTATAEFVASLGSPHVDLLPYHNYGEGKYLILDQPYPMSGTARPSREHMERCRAFFTDRGIDCTIH